MSLFIAWMPPGDALARLRALRDAQRAADTTRRWASWRRDAQLHMTLRYLTDDTPAQPTGLHDALESIAAAHAPTTVAFDRVDAWPHVLVARGEPSPPLRALFDALDRAALGAGYAAQRAQTPHVTLAYPRRGASDVPESKQEPVVVTPPLDACIDEFRVVRTVPGAYATVARYPLRG